MSMPARYVFIKSPFLQRKPSAAPRRAFRRFLCFAPLWRQSGFCRILSYYTGGMQENQEKKCEFFAIEKFSERCGFQGENPRFLPPFCILSSDKIHAFFLCRTDFAKWGIRQNSTGFLKTCQAVALTACVGRDIVGARNEPSFGRERAL